MIFDVLKCSITQRTGRCVAHKRRPTVSQPWTKYILCAHLSVFRICSTQETQLNLPPVPLPSFLPFHPNHGCTLISYYSSGERAQRGHQEQNPSDREDGASVLRVEVSSANKFSNSGKFGDAVRQGSGVGVVYSFMGHINLFSIIIFQGRVRIGPAAEGADPNGCAAPGSPLWRKDVAEQRPAGILAKPQNNVVRRGQGKLLFTAVREGGDTRFFHLSSSFQGLDKVNERMPPRKDAVPTPGTSNSSLIRAPLS